MSSRLNGYVVGGLLLAGATLIGINNSPPSSLEERIERHVDESTGQLAGHTVNDFNTRNILGVQGIIPQATLEHDYQAQLRHLWQLKEINSGATPQARRLGEQLISEYNQETATKMSLDEYVEGFNQTIQRTEVDWRRLQATKLFGQPQRLPLLQELARSVDAKDLLAYQVTELVGTGDGERDVAALDYVLRRAGREYVESIPSTGDALASFAGSQITSLAVKEINRTQNTQFSLEELRADDHHETAYRNSVIHLADLVREAPNEEILHTLTTTNRDVLATYLAVANYRPVNARKAMREWMKNPQSKLSFYLEDNGRIKAHEYANKTFSNLEALYENPVWQEKPSMPPSLFTQAGTNSQGKIVKRYNVRPGDNASSIARLFNDFNQEVHQGAYKPVSVENVRDVDGKEVGVLYPNNPVYVLTTSNTPQSK